jgi:hypothetical protein
VLLGVLDQAFPRASVIAVICDNDSNHHARAVTAYLKEQARLSFSTAPGTARMTIRRADLGGAEELRDPYRRQLAGRLRQIRSFSVTADAAWPLTNQSAASGSASCSWAS